MMICLAIVMECYILSKKGQDFFVIDREFWFSQQQH